MKKILLVLIMLQISILIPVGLFLFAQNAHQSIFRNNAFIMVAVSNDEEFDLFLDILNDTNVAATRERMIGNNNIIHSSTDTTLGGRINLVEGRFPIYEKEFISNIQTNSENQTGVFRDIIPGRNLFIYGLYSANHFFTGDIFKLSTSHIPLVNYIMDYLYQNIFDLELAMISNLGFLHLFLGIALERSLNELIIFFIFNLLLILSIILSIAYYILSQSKKIDILIANGYKKLKICGDIIYKLFDYKFILIGLFLIYICLSIFLLSSNTYSSFFSVISLLFWAGCFIFISILLLIAFIFTYLFVFFKNLKFKINTGKSIVHIFLQIISLSTKVVFIAVFITNIFFGMDTLADFLNRRNSLENWEIARNIYSTGMASYSRLSGGRNLAISGLAGEKLIYLYDYLSGNNNAFVMDTLHFENMEWQGLEYNPLRIYFDDDGTNMLTHIAASPNYFNFNPIISEYGNPITEYIIFDDYTLNVIVPYSIKHMENEIREHFLEYFYFHKVDINNLFNFYSDERIHITPFNYTTIDELDINIIFARDNQSYFTFNQDIRVAYENKILDPIVLIFTNNFHSSYITSILSRGHLFFEIDDMEVYEIIENILLPNPLIHVIPIYDEMLQSFTFLNEEVMVSTFVLIFSIIVGIGISYSIFSNYYEKNKYKIVVKKVFGYSILKTHYLFFIWNFIFFVPIFIVTYLIFDIRSLFIGSLLIILDALIFIFKENSLKTKHFNKVLKGDTK
ncbi:MAG: DUF1430 domain-containing protein [Defluviitaleaceae bacterium]|nr:DUF1430 domain-containing protein [Defluviitaleaceae bacterium]